LSKIERIVQWNEERKLLENPTTFKKESCFILEELIEGLVGSESKEARRDAEEIVDIISNEAKKGKEITTEDEIDALCDIVVFAVGAIRKLGYNPSIALDEVIKEIESRKGKIIDGKFIKDKSLEAQKNWYKANFSKAKI